MCIEEIGDSDDDIPERLLKKSFAITLPKYYDPNKPILNGEDYLHRVMYESQHSASVAVSNIDSRQFDKNQTVYITNEVEFINTPLKLLPTELWQKNVLEEFNSFRSYIQSKIHLFDTIHFKKDFSWLKRLDNEYPKYPELLHLNAYAQNFLLGLIIQKLERVEPGKTINQKFGCWIYSLLSILELPLYPTFYALLRTLVRKIIFIRAKLLPNTKMKQYNSLNLIICIIGKYYKQYDLADN